MRPSGSSMITAPRVQLDEPLAPEIRADAGGLDPGSIDCRSQFILRQIDSVWLLAPLFIMVLFEHAQKGCQTGRCISGTDILGIKAHQAEHTAVVLHQILQKSRPCLIHFLKLCPCHCQHLDLLDALHRDHRTLAWADTVHGEQRVALVIAEDPRIAAGIGGIHLHDAIQQEIHPAGDFPAAA